MLTAYILISGVHKPTWGGWTRDAFKGWLEFLRLGIPGVAMLCSEWYDAMCWPCHTL